MNFFIFAFIQDAGNCNPSWDGDKNSLIQSDYILNYLISLSPCKHDIKIMVDPERLRPIDADLQVPDTRKFYEHTGWQPEISFEKTMGDLLNYWRERVGVENAACLVR